MQQSTVYTSQYSDYHSARTERIKELRAERDELTAIRPRVGLHDRRIADIDREIFRLERGGTVWTSPTKGGFFLRHQP